MSKKRKKKKTKDKIRAKIKKQKKLEKEKKNKVVRFKCLNCGVEEDIPRDVVEMLDFQDLGDISVPPRFDCKECEGQMEPIKYTSVHGVTYEFEK